MFTFSVVVLDLQTDCILSILFPVETDVLVPVFSQSTDVVVVLKFPFVLFTTRVVRLSHPASRTRMSHSTYQVLKSLQIFHYRGRSAGKRKKQARVSVLSYFDGCTNMHTKSQVPTENNSYCSIAHYEINADTVEQ